MQVLVDLWEIFGDKGSVDRNRVSGQRGFASAGGIFIEVLQDFCARLFVTNPRRDLGDQAGGRMHLAHEVIHPVQRLLAGLDDQIHALTQNIELRVGDQDGNLDQNVLVEF